LPQGCIRIDSTAIAKSEMAKLREFDPSVPHDFTAVWAYYHWSNTAVRIPEEDAYLRLRTARNRDLITESEQIAYRNTAVGIAGLSVGSAVLESIVMTGGPKKLRIADPDTIEIANLNRIKARLPDVGLNKAVVAARRVWELDPFADIDVLENGIATDAVSLFPRGLSVVVDAMDSIPLKFSLREACKSAHVPLVMGTDNGDGAIVDVERFDLEPDRPIFHGRVSDELNIAPTTREEFSRIAAKIIDLSLFTQGDSVSRVGKTLAGVPQLGTAASVTGAAVACAVRLIVTGENMPSGRYVMDINASLANASA
jgi:tRNA threonylcarbamoyladenosine dehydratase